MNRYQFVFVLLFIGRILVGQSPGVEAVLNAVRLDSLVNVVKQFTGEEAVTVGGQTDTIRSRYIMEPGNELAFQFVKQKMQDYGWATEDFTFNSAGGKNLIGKLQGTGIPEKVVMLGAHYDNLPPVPNAPGADDNASGCAAVLEVARVLSGQQFPFSIVLALWDEEEQGAIGSGAYAAYISANEVPVQAYINLDMLGWDSNNDHLAEIQVRNIAFSPDLAQKAVWADSVYGVGLELNVVNPGITSSDHGPFWEEGMTAINISESYFNDINPHYHSASDNLDYINIPYFEKLAKLSIATLLEYGFEVSTVSVSTAEPADLSDFVIYPNPAQDVLRMLNDGAKCGKLHWRIINTLGQTVKEGFCDTPNDTIAIGELPKGIYRFGVVNRLGKTAFQTFIKI